jgi:hypothetical protein
LNTSKEVSQQLYALLGSVLGSDWRTKFNTFDAAVVAACDEAQALQRKHRELMKSRAERLPQLPKVDEGEMSDVSSGSPFDNSPTGQACHAERKDAVGRELPNSEEDEESGGGKRGAAPGRDEDSLFHPGREHSGKPYVWKHRAPRDGGAIKC